MDTSVLTEPIKLDMPSEVEKTVIKALQQHSPDRILYYQPKEDERHMEWVEWPSDTLPHAKLYLRNKANTFSHDMRTFVGRFMGGERVFLTECKNGCGLLLAVQPDENRTLWYTEPEIWWGCNAEC